MNVVESYLRVIPAKAGTGIQVSGVNAFLGLVLAFSLNAAAEMGPLPSQGRSPTFAGATRCFVIPEKVGAGSHVQKYFAIPAQAGIQVSGVNAFGVWCYV
ncbi:hypothetical protein AZF00_01105 [Zhongshania aliphaticivorans]|uniref:Uncharacterized protein n=1 Tax=Zhongshania aliphaticivorans TaxID=1470434 RepID=A0A127M180_9GAMM|nr:hypothetical protein AZF00_01105 [Zhongshania aliphaticivorans]